MRVHPYSDAARDLAAANSLAQALGKYHGESLPRHAANPGRTAAKRDQFQFGERVSATEDIEAAESKRRKPQADHYPGKEFACNP
jgi:hypothetical protein